MAETPLQTWRELRYISMLQRDIVYGGNYALFGSVVILPCLAEYGPRQVLSW